MNMEFKQYRRKQIAELADWFPGFDMVGVSISDVDEAAGSPKTGDKIARNPANHADRWLVAADYFTVNFEAVAPHPAQENKAEAADSGEWVRVPREWQELVESFGRTVTDMFEQMERGNWVDDHGHDVRLNASMIALKPPVLEAIKLRAMRRVWVAHRSDPLRPARTARKDPPWSIYEGKLKWKP